MSQRNGPHCVAEVKSAENMAREWRRWLPVASVLTAASLAALIALARADGVQYSFREVAECATCLFWQSFRSDCWLICLVAGLGAIGLLSKSVAARLIVALAMSLVIAAMAADLLIFRSLALRLYYTDVEKFGTELRAIARFLSFYFQRSWPWILGGTVLSSLVLPWPFVREPRRQLRTAALLTTVSLGSLAWASAGSGYDLQYVHEESVRNVAAINFDSGVSRRYSGAFVKAIGENGEPPGAVCANGRAIRPNIVILVVESLSAYHSDLLGGRGWTPQLDRISMENTWFSNFHANGFTTDQGLIALLTGRFPLPAVGRYGSSRAYDGFGSPAGTLPTLANSLGYATAFLTTGDLGFLEKGVWSKSIGFAHVEGAENPFYDGMPRMHFNAAPDRALFARFMDWYRNRDSTRPFLATLLTVSSHPPYIHPETRESGEQAVVRYVDAQLGEFYERLKMAGFFDQGILIITGDHRAMTPVATSERVAYRERALSRVPFIVAGSKHALPPKRIDTLAQQADLVHSLGFLISAEYCRPNTRANFFAWPSLSPSFVIHVRGDRRSWLNVYRADGDGVVNLNGDQTGWVGDPPTDGESIVAEINSERIAIGAVEQDILGYVMRIRAGQSGN